MDSQSLGTIPTCDIGNNLRITVKFHQIYIPCKYCLYWSQKKRRSIVLPPACVGYAIHNWTRHLPIEEIPESAVAIVGGDVDGLSKILSATDSCRRRVIIEHRCMTTAWLISSSTSVTSVQIWKGPFLQIGAVGALANLQSKQVIYTV